MKFLTLLLAAFILLLAIKPGIDTFSLLNNSEQTCCGGQCTPDSEKEQDASQDPANDNDCDGNQCNPFQVCSSCVLVCLAMPLDFIPKPTVFAPKGSANHAAFISQFASDFWQPPRIV